MIAFLLFLAVGVVAVTCFPAASRLTMMNLVILAATLCSSDTVAPLTFLKMRVSSGGEKDAGERMTSTSSSGRNSSSRSTSRPMSTSAHDDRSTAFREHASDDTVNPKSTTTTQQVQVKSKERVFAVVFGEGVFNDVVSVLLVSAANSMPTGSMSADSEVGSMLSMLATLVWFLGSSTAVGLLFGVGISFVSRKLMQYPKDDAAVARAGVEETNATSADHDILEHVTTEAAQSGEQDDSGGGTSSAAHEVAILMLGANYTCYAVAELLDVSSILALFVCAVTCGHYGKYNMSEQARVCCEHVYPTLAHAAEGALFGYFGLCFCTYLVKKPAEAVPRGAGQRLVLTLVLLYGLSLVVIRLFVVFSLAAIARLVDKAFAPCSREKKGTEMKNRAHQWKPKELREADASGGQSKTSPSGLREQQREKGSRTRSPTSSHIASDSSPVSISRKAGVAIAATPLDESGLEDVCICIRSGDTDDITEDVMLDLHLRPASSSTSRISSISVVGDVEASHLTSQALSSVTPSDTSLLREDDKNCSTFSLSKIPNRASTTSAHVAGLSPEHDEVSRTSSSVVLEGQANLGSFLPDEEKESASSSAQEHQSRNRICKVKDEDHSAANIKDSNRNARTHCTTPERSGPDGGGARSSTQTSTSTLSSQDLLIIATAGMMRGTIAFALVIKATPVETVKNAAIVQSTVLLIVLGNCCVIGILFPVLLRCLYREEGIGEEEDTAVYGSGSALAASASFGARSARRYDNSEGLQQLPTSDSHHQRDELVRCARGSSSSIEDGRRMTDGTLSITDAGSRSISMTEAVHLRSRTPARPNRFHRAWLRFDERVLKPYLGGQPRARARPE
ncbi:unnamed protein product [Amoebophrya sp. A25]|nr:unnamed protein product [Amoebophrya sp. A25]|eukprot:GSA25T00000006001.1